MKTTDEGMAFAKKLVKRYPRLYRVAVYIFGGQPQNTTAYQFIKQIPSETKIVNIGSGPRRIEGVTNLDIQPFEGVDVVADAAQTPFESESIDAIVCDNVLEHTPNPQAVVAEMLRVLKPGGQVYVAVPFVIPYHSSPGDFYRWTEEGLRELLKDFEEKELKIQYGPSAAFTFVFCEWLALLFSFNNRFLYTAVLFLATIVTAPLKLFDYLLVHYNGAHSMPLDFYFIGKKKE